MKILGFSGRKQAGKDTCAKWIFGVMMRHLDIISASDVMGDGKLFGEFLEEDGSISRHEIDPAHKTFSSVWPFAKTFRFADKLKEFVTKTLGCDPQLIYGTDADKSKPTHIAVNSLRSFLNKKTLDKMQLGIDHDGTHVTARGILKVFGTDVCRAMFNKCWVNSCLNDVRDSGSELSLILDVRFPDEVEAIQEAGGKVIRLDRVVFPEDSHESETALDSDKYDWSNFDYVLKNSELAWDQQFGPLYHKLVEWDYVPFRIA